MKEIKKIFFVRVISKTHLRRAVICFNIFCFLLGYFVLFSFQRTVPPASYPDLFMSIYTISCILPQWTLTCIPQYLCNQHICHDSDGHLRVQAWPTNQLINCGKLLDSPSVPEEIHPRLISCYRPSTGSNVWPLQVAVRGLLWAGLHFSVCPTFKAHRFCRYRQCGYTGILNNSIVSDKCWYIPCTQIKWCEILRKFKNFRNIPEH